MHRVCQATGLTRHGTSCQGNQGTGFDCPVLGSSALVTHKAPEGKPIMNELTERTFDYLIIGGGTAGCVLAARLSENPQNRVLLVEAGVDFPPGLEPASIRDPYPSSYGDPQFFWPELVAEIGASLGEGQPRFSRQYVQGRCIGGSSSIMGMVAMRGLPADYDEWRDLGATGWGWSDVLPFFIRSERDLNFAGPLHGTQGPIPIRRIPRQSWPPFCQAFAEVLESRGHAFLPDYNGQFGDGVSALPMNNLPDRRVSTAMGYLDEAVRRRANLTILTEATVQTLRCSERRVVGAIARTASGAIMLTARETLVCAGAIHTPALLMRSGIGPGVSLNALGIEVVADLAGVGRNLLNHVALPLAVDLKPRAWQPSSERSWSFSVLRYSSGHAGCPPGDMMMVPMNKTSWHPLGRRIGLLGVSVYKTYSRGEVSLKAADPQVAPAVRMNTLDDARDLIRLVKGVGWALELLRDPRIAALRNEIFLPPGGQANSLNRPSFMNWLKSLILRELFAVSGTARRRVLRRGLLDPERLASDAEALRQTVLQAAAPVHHICGTCKIGRADDPLAVLDPTLRVRDIDGLRVADASVMPTIVSANTHIPVIMIAEKAAAVTLASARSRDAAAVHLT